jgi:hypothetical protein
MVGVRPEAESAEGGGEVLIFECGKAEKGKTKGKLLLTKLLLLSHQVTLSQIPPSQKEMWGAESKPHFPACPHANSSCTSVLKCLRGGLHDPNEFGCELGLGVMSWGCLDCWRDVGCGERWQR